MSPLHAISECFSKYASFHGTASRSEYWWFVLFCVLASALIGWFSNIADVIFNIATLIPLLAAGARRLHDTDRSGWWLLLMLVPLVGWVVLLVFMIEGSKANRYGMVGSAA